MAVYDMIEKRIRGIVKDEQLGKLKRYIQRSCAIDCLWLLHMKKGRWGAAKEYAEENDWTLCDVIFRDRMREAEDIGLATSEPINNDRRKREWTETDVGYQVAEAFLGAFSKAKQAYKQRSQKLKKQDKH